MKYTALDGTPSDVAKPFHTALLLCCAVCVLLGMMTSPPPPPPLRFSSYSLLEVRAIIALVSRLPPLFCSAYYTTTAVVKSIVLFYAVVAPLRCPICCAWLPFIPFLGSTTKNKGLSRRLRACRLSSSVCASSRFLQYPPPHNSSLDSVRDMAKRVVCVNPWCNAALVPATAVYCVTAEVSFLSTHKQTSAKPTSNTRLALSPHAHTPAGILLCPLSPVGLLYWYLDNF